MSTSKDINMNLNMDVSKLLRLAFLAWVVPFFALINNINI